MDDWKLKARTSVRLKEEHRTFVFLFTYNFTLLRVVYVDYYDDQCFRKLSELQTPMPFSFGVSDSSPFIFLELRLKTPEYINSRWFDSYRYLTFQVLVITLQCPLFYYFQSGYIYGPVNGNSDAVFTALPVRMRLSLKLQSVKSDSCYNLSIYMYPPPFLGRIPILI